MGQNERKGKNIAPDYRFFFLLLVDCVEDLARRSTREELDGIARR